MASHPIGVDTPIPAVHKQTIEVSKIRIPEFEYSIPIDIKDIVLNPYIALTKPDLMKSGKRYVIVNTTPSEDHPGYIHYSILSVVTGEKVWSKRPTTPAFASCAIEFELEKSGLKCIDLKWKEDKDASDTESKANRLFSLTQEYVYFLRAGTFIKIGKTTGDPSHRISSLQTGCPFKITLAAHMKGGLERELELHKRFISYKSHGEWFHDRGEIKEFVDSLIGENK